MHLLVAPDRVLRRAEVGRADHELPAPHRRMFAHVLHERPIAVIGHDQVIHDDLGLMLIDERPELEGAGADVVNVADDRDKPGSLEAEAEDVQHVLVCVEECDHLGLGLMHPIPRFSSRQISCEIGNATVFLTNLRAWQPHSRAARDGPVGVKMEAEGSMGKSAELPG